MLNNELSNQYCSWVVLIVQAAQSAHTWMACLSECVILILNRHG